MTNQKHIRENENIDLRAIVKEFVKYWYLYTFFLVVALVVAVIINKIAPPAFKVSSSLLISSGEDTRTTSRTEFIEGLELTTQNKEVQNEIMVLKSQPLVENVVKSLGFQVSYYSKADYLPYRFAGLKSLSKYFFRNIYKNSPYEVVIDPTSFQAVNVNFNIDILSNEEFSLSIKEEDVDIYDYVADRIVYTNDDHKDIFIDDRFSFGEEIKGPNYSFKVFLKSSYNNEYQAKDLYFSFNNIKSLASAYKTALEIVPSDEKATVVSIAFEGPSISKCTEFVNGITNEYLQKDLAKKNYLAISTIDYIDKQISEISDSLTMSERELQSFRRQNQVMNIDAKSDRVAQQLRELENQKNEKQQELRFYRELSNHFDASKDSPNLLAPSSMGVSDPVLNGLFQQLIEKNVEKNTLIDRNQQRNPRYRTLTVQIEDLKSSISQNIVFFVNSTSNALGEINATISRYRYEEGKLPQTERQLLEITRRFELNDEIYTFLLRKRAEAQIAKASNLPDSEIVEPAQFIGQTSPRTMRNYLLAIFTGFFVPFVFLQLKKAFNNRISDKKEVTKITGVPIVGKINHNIDSSPIVLATDSTSPISDAYRSLRTNLEFYTKGKENSIILVTSTMGNDGKSFTSLNLASSFAFNDKKTLVLGFDLRKPSELFSEYGTENVPGISSYLIGKSEIEDLIIKTPVNNLDLIHAGVVPPNSLELISSEKTNVLFKKLKSIYDYIIIDSAPVGLLPDAFVLMKQSDINLLVVRHNFTIKEYFIETIQDLEQKAVENLFIVYNDEIIAKNLQKYKQYYSTSSK